MAGSSDSPVRVVLVEDHPLFRRGLRELLVEHGVDVIGEAGSGEIALPLIARTGPDVVVMDLSMPGMGGVEATRRLHASHPDIGVLVMTASSEEEDVLDAVMAGAAGYLLKEAAVPEILSGIEAAASGQASITPAVAAQLVQRLRRHETRQANAPLPDGISARERDVLRLLAQGRDNQAIAGELLIGLGTVKSHVTSVLEKLGVENRVQAAVLAARAGLV